MLVTHIFPPRQFLGRVSRWFTNVSRGHTNWFPHGPFITLYLSFVDILSAAAKKKIIASILMSRCGTVSALVLNSCLFLYIAGYFPWFVKSEVKLLLELRPLCPPNAGFTISFSYELAFRTLYHFLYKIILLTEGKTCCKISRVWWTYKHHETKL